MNLVSESFIWFMIITTILYYLSPKKVKKYTLLMISVITLACLGWENLAYILFSTISTYLAGLCIEKGKNKKAILIGTVGINSIILIIMKIVPYINSKPEFNLIVPLGISYYTFQVISYLVDVYREKYSAERNFFHFALYVMYFPYLFVGPINRFDQIKQSLIEEENKKFNIESFYEGILKISMGFFKKLMVVSRIHVIISTITGDTTTYTGAYALLAMILYSIEIYADFSGAIDIVVGFSKILQIRLTSNFNLPYLATSINDFWHRWHMSLGRWFKDYIYIPLGGNRKGKVREYINILIVFTVSGLWHGANYILWGILHGIFTIFDRLRGDKKRNRPISIVVTFLLVSILWSFFIWPDTITSLKMIGSLFTTFNYVDMFQNVLHLGINLQNIILLLGCIVLLVIIALNKSYLETKMQNADITVKCTIVFLLISIILIFGWYGIGFDVSQFIYNKF